MSARATCGLPLPDLTKGAGRSVSLVGFMLFTALSLTGIAVPGSAARAQEATCTCRYQGNNYGVGESICLKGPDGLRMATCGMVLNNTSWQFSKDPCPFSSLDRQLSKRVDVSRTGFKLIVPLQVSELVYGSRTRDAGAVK